MRRAFYIVQPPTRLGREVDAWETFSPTHISGLRAAYHCTRRVNGGAGRLRGRAQLLCMIRYVSFNIDMYSSCVCVFCWVGVNIQGVWGWYRVHSSAVWVTGLDF